MKNKERNEIKAQHDAHLSSIESSSDICLDFAQYRLSSLADEIKSKYLKFRKTKEHFIIP